MSVIAIIPSRKGSKGLPRKSFQLLGGKPLWTHSLLAAAGAVDDVVVATDDVELCDEAQRVGARAVLLAEQDDYATLDSSLVTTARLLNLGRGDTVVVLQPTVPIRRRNLVRDCVDLSAHSRSLLTVNRLRFVWNSHGFQINGRRLRQSMHPSEFFYHEDGSVYVVRADRLLEHGSRVIPPCDYVETDPTVDIDTPADLARAEKILTKG